jgi:hypothetical protein
MSSKLLCVVGLFFMITMQLPSVLAQTGDDVLTTETIVVSENTADTVLGRYIADKARAFSKSDIEFSRARGNAPFLPVAYLGTSYYDDATVREFPEAGGSVRYQESTASAAGGLPFLLNQTDALVLGFYASHSEFTVDDSSLTEAEKFRVDTAAIGLGYVKQWNDDWQLMGFLLPFYNDNNLETGQSYWQTMGGVFARYTASNDVWWMFGAFASTSPFDKYWLPYVGISYTIDKEWTISGIMPWPQVIYAPSPDWFVAVGGMISGSGWAIDAQQGVASRDINAFDLGVDFSRRIKGSLWASVSAGVGGLRALQFDDGSDLDGPSFDVSRSPFIRLNLAIRPGDTF